VKYIYHPSCVLLVVNIHRFIIFSYRVLLNILSKNEFNKIALLQIFQVSPIPLKIEFIEIKQFF
jgi:hypothetical protein